MHLRGIPLIALAFFFLVVATAALPQRDVESQSMLNWDRLLKEAAQDKVKHQLLKELQDKVGANPGAIQYALQFSGPSSGQGNYAYWQTTAKNAVFTTVITNNLGPNTTISTTQGSSTATFLADIWAEGSQNTGVYNFTGTGNVTFGESFNILLLETYNGSMQIYFGFSSASAHWTIRGGLGVFNTVMGFVTSNMLFDYYGNVALDNHWGIVVFLPGPSGEFDSDKIQQARELLAGYQTVDHLLVR